jgi:hypothetical protein
MIPAILFIHVLYFVKNEITTELTVVDKIEMKSKGNPIPNPNKIKFNIFVIGSTVNAARAKKAAIKPGLQGNIIPPKKKPNKKELIIGFLTWGVFNFGKYLLKSKSKIKTKLTSARTIKAIGDTISTTLVSDI